MNAPERAGAALLAALAAASVAAAALVGPASDRASTAEDAASGRRRPPVVDRGPGRDGTDESPQETTSTTGAPPAEAAPLLALLPEDLTSVLGPSAERVPDDEAGTGVGALDVAAASAAEPDPGAERSLLETRRFVAGAGRAWRADGDRRAYVAIYRFSDDAGAAAYLVDGLEAVAARGATTEPVAELPGATLFAQGGQGATGATAAYGVAQVRGPLFALSFVAGPPSPTAVDDARRLGALVASRLTQFGALG